MWYYQAESTSTDTLMYSFKQKQSQFKNMFMW